ncbi:SRPBCC family protein [Ruegeria sp. 6PALISEP08]|uniref:SRPBCC family protein n=1 Tax=Ruegeria sp. 6PALISEP08 TaxID=1225660 RepID=UPI00067EEAFE|nr:SRPBCC family protein [Ruegeria sp. 6PALISEP08]
MKVVLRILAGLGLIAVAVVAVSYLLPGKAEVSRSITIDAPAEAIFPYVNSMQETEQWSPWLHRDPDTQLTYSGPEAGVGNALNWSSEHPQVGTGSQVIVESVENQRVQTELDFGPMGTATVSFLLEPGGNSTLVTWGFESDLGLNPISRWMGLMMDKWVGGDYQRGLTNLKALIENST